MTTASPTLDRAQELVARGHHAELVELLGQRSPGDLAASPELALLYGTAQARLGHHEEGLRWLDLALAQARSRAEEALARRALTARGALALVSGRVHAHASTIDALKTIQREHQQMAIVPGSFGASEVAFALPKGDQALAARVNDFIREVKKNGRVTQLLDKYGLDASFAAN